MISFLTLSVKFVFPNLKFSPISQQYPITDSLFFYTLKNSSFKANVYTLQIVAINKTNYKRYLSYIDLMLQLLNLLISLNTHLFRIFNLFLY